jgi:integrase
VPLPGLPGSPEFNEAYAAALAGQTAPRLEIGAKRVRAGTIGAVVLAYFHSADFLNIPSPLTRATYRNIIEAFTKEHGDKPLAALERRHIKAMLASKVATPAAANLWLRLIKKLMRFAVEEGLRGDDPAVGIAHIKTRPTGGFHSWTEDEIAQFNSRHPIGTKARLALGLLLYTAQRRSDVVTMGPQHVQNGKVRVRQQKTGATLRIPVHPDLQAILNATPRKDLTFLVTQYGKPYTAAGFGSFFRDCCDDAGLPQECAAHGLRKAACRRLAEAGCSANVIASISGHTTLREVERYTKAADQERMAETGMAAIISRTEVATAAEPVWQPRKK